MATYLQLVQKAIRKSGAKIDEPSTIVGATGLTAMFVEWVQDAWKDIQLEHLRWKWRVSRDLTLNITSATDEYSLPGTLEFLDKRTVSIYEAGDTSDESPLRHENYHVWRTRRDTADQADAQRPQCFTITPDDVIAFFPPPDQNYTVRYDGILAVELLDDTDNSDTPTGIDAVYHDAIVWKAVEYYAAHYEDGAKLNEAQNRFLPYKKFFENRELEPVEVDTTALYRRGWGYYA